MFVNTYLASHSDVWTSILFRHSVLKGNASTHTLSNLVPTADSFTSVLDGVAQDLELDNALNLADQVVMGMHPEDSSMHLVLISLH